MSTFVYPAVLDVNDALRLIQLAVDEKGFDHKLEVGCSYVRNGEPLCIVGVGLHLLGVDVVAVFGDSDSEELGQAANSCRIGSSAYDGLAGVAEKALNRAGIRITTDARALLSAAQDAQDRGACWGEAQNAALKTRLAQISPPF